MFAALALSHWIEHQTGWSIKKFVRTAAEPPPHDHGEALAKIPGSDGVRQPDKSRVRLN